MESVTPGSATPNSEMERLERDVGDRNKKGRSTSCYLCQKRKQKCDHRFPSCTTCIRAGVECVKPMKYGAKPAKKDEYTVLLEKKIKFLEKILDKHMSQEENSKLLRKNQALNNYKKMTPFIYDQQQDSSLPLPVANSISASRFLPNISEFEKKFDRDSLKNLDFNLETGDYNDSFISKYNLKEFSNCEPVFEIDENYSRQLLDIYFSRLQYKLPLLDEREILKIHESYFNNDLKKLINDGDYFHISFAKLWLVFAILASLHMTTGRYTGPPPKRLFCTGLRHIAKCRKIDDLSRIEILTLIVIFLTRTDRDSIGVYLIIGDLTKLCVDLNLHKSRTYRDEADPKLRDRKMRVFWCCYIFEKTTAILVSKLYVLPESMMDPDLPLFEYEPSSALHPKNGPIFINQTIKIRRIELRFVENLNIISTRAEVSKSQLPLVESFFAELDNWRRSCEGFIKGAENETLSIYYYRSVRVLIQPFLELLDPEDKLFKECQAAAGQICQLFKQFHQKTVFGHSTTHIHTVFVAGVTLIYCLWLQRNSDDMRRKQLGDVSKHTRPQVTEALFSGLDDLRLCSVCLYVMSERTKFALSFRDTFDELMNATIGNLILRCGPDSSEIIYDTRPGMPPAIVRQRMHHFSLDESNSRVNFKKTDDEILEEAERKKKQGQLQKSIPKSLSHLLIHSPPLNPESVKDENPMEQKTSNYQLQQQNQDLNFNSSMRASLLSQQQQPLLLQQQQQYQPNPQMPMFSGQASEITPFNGRTTLMINNISTWTGESGQQINTGLLNFNLTDLDDLFFNGVGVVNENYGFTP